MESVEESLALARQGRDLQSEGIAMAERSLRHQEEMIRLLRLLVGFALSALGEKITASGRS